MEVSIVLFKDYETLDVFGPVELFGRLAERFRVKFYALSGGAITNHHGVTVLTESLEIIAHGTDILLIPGGRGTRKEVSNEQLIELIKKISDRSKFVLTVCTGSALLARTGLLDHRPATTNKIAFEWVRSTGPDVHWQQKARWTVDGKFYTSASVSAGMDMVLGFIGDRHGIDLARNTAADIEYHWNENKDEDQSTNL